MSSPRLRALSALLTPLDDSDTCVSLAILGKSNVSKVPVLRQALTAAGSVPGAGLALGQINQVRQDLGPRARGS